MMKLISFKNVKLAVIVICMLAAGICYSCSMREDAQGPAYTAIELEDPAYPAEETGEPGIGPKAAGNGGEDAADSPSQEAALVYVHVCGRVCSPGVYGLPEGSRVYEAIEKAGGFAEDAARDYLNMAQVLEDGMKLQIPDRSQADEWTAQGLTDSAGGRRDAGESGRTAKVNLNTASKEELMTLRGIGEARAEDIIRYRDTFGGFKAIEDIMNVSGIKDAAFEKIKDSITV